MLRPCRESLHSDGITDQKSLQQTSATKSARSGHVEVSSIGPLLVSWSLLGHQYCAPDRGKSFEVRWNGRLIACRADLAQVDTA
jgi:hypothetical protein